MKEKKGGKKMFVFLCVSLFIVSVIIGVISKFATPAWAKKYNVAWSDEVGILLEDIAYGEGEYNKFDLYLPKDGSRDNYGLVVYLHAGGFTSGDKKEDRGILSWLCSKGYVAVGINYTLRTDDNDKSVLSQSFEIKDAIPKVIEEAKKHGYNIDKIAMSGGSAGGALAMLYAYRDKDSAPVPVKLLFEMVGPSSYFKEDWGIYGLDKDTPESIKAAAGLFSVMGGVEITPEMIEDNSYVELMKPISSYAYVNLDTVPSVLLYGVHDKIQPFKSVERLEKVLKENNVDYKLFVAKHSGHGIQNDNDVMKKYMETVEEYLDKYMPV